MKGPALQYDARALRTFVCDACGRQCPLPGRFTSCQCSCSSPPRWMRLLDRPAVVVPDVSQFVSPADPADSVVDENESDEVIPGWKPPIFERPPQGPQRRRLSEDIAPDDTGDVLTSSGEDAGFGETSPVSHRSTAGETAQRRDSPRSGRDRSAGDSSRTSGRDSRAPRRDRHNQSGKDRPQGSSERPAGRGRGERRPLQRPPQSPPRDLPVADRSSVDDFGTGVEPDPFTSTPGGQSTQRPSGERAPERATGRGPERGPRRGRRRGRRGPEGAGSPPQNDS
jgi:hypothetical protein